MSYNIDHAVYIGAGRLTITRGLQNLLFQELEGCEASFLDPDNEKYCLERCLQVIDVGNNNEILLIKIPMWSGEGSGYSYDSLIDKVLPETHGHAQLLFVWEGGDSFTGLDGVVVEKEVIFSLGDVIGSN